ncbi:hypothetical protein EC988_006129, partial [Linderina pennispora]
MPFDDEELRSAPDNSGAAAGDNNGTSGGNSGSMGWDIDPTPSMGSPRDKFRRERDSPDRRDRFGRDRRSRSRSPEDSRSRHRSRSPIRRPPAGDDGDRYIPHYERERGGGRDRDRSGDRYQSGGRYGGYNGGHRGYSGRSGRSGRGGDMDGGYGNGDMGGRGGVTGGMLDPRSYDQVVPFKYFAEWLKTQDGGRRLEQDEIRERYEDYRREALQRLYT